MSRDRELHTFLMSAFSPGALQQWLYFTFGGDLVDHLPLPSEGSAAFAFAALRELGRRGLVADAFFAALRKEFPGRSSEIQILAAAWAVPQPAPGAESPRRERPAPVSANPFAPFSTFVGREAELRRVGAELRSGSSTLLIGGRRAGKTALIQQLDGLGRPVYRLNAGAWQLEGEEEVFGALGRALGSPCRDRDSAEAALRERAPLIVVIDEFDRLLNCAWVHNLLVFLRYLDDDALSRSVSFLLTGGPRLWDYSNPRDGGSPALNTMEPVFLQPLDSSAREELVVRLGDRPIDRERLAVEAGGHPHLLCRVLSLIWLGAALEGALQDVFTAHQRDFDAWAGQLGERGLALLGKIPDAGRPLADLSMDGPLAGYAREWAILRSLALVEIDGDQVLPRPRLFRRWLAARG